jgi:hypothetical protein
MPIPEAIPEAENYTDEPVKSPGFETVLYLEAAESRYAEGTTT